MVKSRKIKVAITVYATISFEVKFSFSTLGRVADFALSVGLFVEIIR